MKFKIKVLIYALTFLSSLPFKAFAFNAKNAVADLKEQEETLNLISKRTNERLQIMEEWQKEVSIEDAYLRFSGFYPGLDQKQLEYLFDERVTKLIEDGIIKMDGIKISGSSSWGGLIDK